MTSKHTPGPWHVEPLVATEGVDMAICCHGWVVAQIMHDPDIQTSDDPSYETVVWHPEDHANASLIAAAPEMFDALDGLVNNGFSDEELATRWGWPVERITAARAAIAKAEGRT